MMSSETVHNSVIVEIVEKPEIFGWFFGRREEVGFDLNKIEPVKLGNGHRLSVIRDPESDMIRVYTYVIRRARSGPYKGKRVIRSISEVMLFPTRPVGEIKEEGNIIWGGSIEIKARRTDGDKST